MNDYKTVTRLRLTCCSALLPGRSHRADIHPCHCSGPSAQAARGNITGTVIGADLTPSTPKARFKILSISYPRLSPTHEPCSPGCGSNLITTNTASPLAPLHLVNHLKGLRRKPTSFHLALKARLRRTQVQRPHSYCTIYTTLGS